MIVKKNLDKNTLDIMLGKGITQYNQDTENFDTLTDKKLLKKFLLKNKGCGLIEIFDLFGFKNYDIIDPTQINSLTNGLIIKYDNDIFFTDKYQTLDYVQELFDYGIISLIKIND